MYALWMPRAPTVMGSPLCTPMSGWLINRGRHDVSHIQTSSGELRKWRAKGYSTKGPWPTVQKAHGLRYKRPIAYGTKGPRDYGTNGPWTMVQKAHRLRSKKPWAKLQKAHGLRLHWGSNNNRFLEAPQLIQTPGLEAVKSMPKSGTANQAGFQRVTTDKSGSWRPTYECTL